MRLWLGIGVCLQLVACGGAATRPEVTPAQAPPTASTAPPPPPAPPRATALNFGGLVRALGTFQQEPGAHAELGCLLGMVADQGALGVTPELALKTLPEAPMHVAEALRGHSARARVLSRWGQRGDGEHDLVVATLTRLTPQAANQPMVVTVLTRDGIYVRETDQSSPATAMNPEDAAVWLLARAARGPLTLIVTAEAESPIQALHAWLRSLPSMVSNVALAVALAPETQLPDTAPSTPDPRSHCPNGLPDLPAGAAEGDLPAASIVRSLSFIHEPLQRCLANTTGPGAAGGRVVLALRIADTGNVVETCLVEDNIGDNVLAACLVETARSATFSRPHPIGFVDVHAPLSLSPLTEPPPRPVCD